MSSLILFGAGASYGSDDVGTPPLCGGLFEGLRRFDPLRWGRLPGSLAMLFASDFEAGMQELARSDPHRMPPLQRAMAAYFFGFQPRSSNLYKALARTIRRVGFNGALATLNYERLLELSLSSECVRPIVGGPPQQGFDVELCFPHGCCHFFNDSVQFDSRGVTFNGGAVSTSGRIIVLGDPRQFAQRIEGDELPPVMSYFEPQKRTSSGKNFVDGQRARFAELASAASTIVLIGVGIRESDSHIWEPLAKTTARIVYCAGRAAATVFRAWAERLRPQKTDLAVEGCFRESFTQLCGEVGLAG